jgi:hypothetical protein
MKTKRCLIAPIVLMGCMTPNTGIAPEFEDQRDVAQSFAYCDWAFTESGTLAEQADYTAAQDQTFANVSATESSKRLAEAGAAIARNAGSKFECESIFAEGQAAFEAQLQASLQSHWAQATYKKKTDPQIADIQNQMAKHWVEDQAARRVYIASKTDDTTGAAFWTRSLAAAHTNNTDQRSTTFMRGLLDQYDWIDSQRFGERVSMGAWLMVQHADDHVDLQQLALSRMEPHLKTGGVSKGDYAFLWDRVAVNTGKKQRYGTQPTWECTPEGTLTLKPLEDPANVNARRKTMGLGTVEDGLASMARSVCG